MRQKILLNIAVALAPVACVVNARALGSDLRSHTSHERGAVHVPKGPSIRLGARPGDGSGVARGRRPRGNGADRPREREGRRHGTRR